MGLITFFMALATAVIGIIPLLVTKRFVAATIVGVVELIMSWPFFYAINHSTAYPFYGSIGVIIALTWVITAFLCLFDTLDYQDDLGQRFVPIIFGIVAIVLFSGRGCSGCGATSANDYKQMIGKVENRVWTQDIQPKDPNHVRLVPHELALWMADTQLGKADSAIGSQYQISGYYMTLQMIGNELVYVAPLDYRGFSVWSSVGSVPGYVMINAEDPLAPIKIVTDQKFVYTPDAWFSDNLERHLRNNGYLNAGLTDSSFEIDESGKAWWVVTVFDLTIAWSGEKIRGVAMVDPTNGDIKFYRLGEVPTWVDRVFPGSFVFDYLNWHYEYVHGWVNSWWAETDCVQPESPSLIYGSDGEPYWVTNLTSTNAADEALVGLVYTNTRTGKSVYYKASGGTEQKVLMAVNNKVKYMNLHGASPVLYNIYGVMAYIVPLLGENYTYQGVAIGRVDNQQVVTGDNAESAFREFQKLIAGAGSTLTPDVAVAKSKLTGRVDRFAQDIREKTTTYYLHLEGIPRLFIGESELSPKLPLTKPGDEVSIEYIESAEAVVPLLGFDNKTILLSDKPITEATGEPIAPPQ